MPLRKCLSDKSLRKPPFSAIGYDSYHCLIRDTFKSLNTSFTFSEKNGQCLATFLSNKILYELSQKNFFDSSPFECNRDSATCSTFPFLCLEFLTSPSITIAQNHAECCKIYQKCILPRFSIHARAIHYVEKFSSSKSLSHKFISIFLPVIYKMTIPYKQELSSKFFQMNVFQKCTVF